MGREEAIEVAVKELAVAFNDLSCHCTAGALLGHGGSFEARERANRIRMILNNLADAVAETSQPPDVAEAIAKLREQLGCAFKETGWGHVCEIIAGTLKEPNPTTPGVNKAFDDFRCRMGSRDTLGEAMRLAMKLGGFRWTVYDATGAKFQEVVGRAGNSYCFSESDFLPKLSAAVAAQEKSASRRMAIKSRLEVARKKVLDNLDGASEEWLTKIEHVLDSVSKQPN